MNTLGATNPGRNPTLEIAAARGPDPEAGEGASGVFGAVLGALRSAAASDPAAVPSNPDRPAGRREEAAEAAVPPGPGEAVDPLFLLAAVAPLLPGAAAPQRLPDSLATLVARAVPAGLPGGPPAAGTPAATGSTALLPTSAEAVGTVAQETRTRVTVLRRETHFAPVLPQTLATPFATPSPASLSASLAAPAQAGATMPVLGGPPEGLLPSLPQRAGLLPEAGADPLPMPAAMPALAQPGPAASAALGARVAIPAAAGSTEATGDTAATLAAGVPIPPVTPPSNASATDAGATRDPRFPPVAHASPMSASPMSASPMSASATASLAPASLAPDGRATAMSPGSPEKAVPESVPAELASSGDASDRDAAAHLTGIRPSTVAGPTPPPSATPTEPPAVLRSAFPQTEPAAAPATLGYGPVPGSADAATAAQDAPVGDVPVPAPGVMRHADAVPVRPPGQIVSGVPAPASPSHGLDVGSRRSAEAGSATPAETAATVPAPGGASGQPAATLLDAAPALSLPGTAPAASAPAQQVAAAVLGQLPRGLAAATPGASGLDGPLRLLTLQLHPADLGTVLVRMRLRDGQLEMSLQASREDTAALLREGGEILTELLRQGGYQPERLTIVGGPPPPTVASEAQAFAPRADAGPNQSLPDPSGRRQPEGRPAPPSETRERIHESVSTNPDRSGVYL
ncbi:flagellar hook-length control protein FliK [Methylobacterium flocculans]|uniref:flagellar hook-length control protein FliK n=1 Tax=Methylobacterium flocculans TaxID=2984843 RepID=UPI0021F3A8D7|nr:flagellar hook-length control protein FliK [Methylobacterium sp. FF17]